MCFRLIIMAEAKRQKLSAYALAKRAGVAIRTTQKYFNNDSDLMGERVARLAAALGLELRPAGRNRSKKGK